MEPKNSDKQKVKRFCDHYIHLRIIRDTYAKLFENERSIRILNRTGPFFFSLVNNVFVHYLILEFSKITDPEKTKQGWSLTAKYMINKIPWPVDISKTLTDLSKSLMRFKPYIKPARDNLIAHNNLNTILAGVTLGAFPKGKDLEFLDTLQKFCDVIHKEAFGIVLGEASPGTPGDVLDVLKALRKSLAFDSLFERTEGQKKAELFKLLKDADLPVR